MDYFGMYKKSECKFGANCRRRDTCTFYHRDARSTESPFGFGSVRCCPSSLKRLGPGFSPNEYRPAIVLVIKPNGEKTIVREWIKLCADWCVIDVTAVKSPSAAKDVTALVDFATRVSGVGRFKGLFDAPSVSVCESNTAGYDKALGCVKADDREFMSHKRFVIDTLLGVYNQALLAYVAEKTPESLLYATMTNTSLLPPNVFKALEEGGLLKKQPFELLDNFPITPRRVANALRDPKFHASSFEKASVLLKRSNGLDTIKFSSPLRGFDSFHNQLVVNRVLSGSSDVVVFREGKSRSQAMSQRADKIASKELEAFKCVSALRVVGLRSLTAPSCVLSISPLAMSIVEKKDLDAVAPHYLLQLK